MAQYKGCPRCGRKMLKEQKGQCDECKKGRYNYMKSLPGKSHRKAQEVYNNKAWTNTRAAVIRRAQGLCEVCRVKGHLVAGEDVHHIIKVTRGDNSTHYDMNNLIYVCKSCHKRIEGMNHKELLAYLGR